jgi:hypothetical protein
VGFGLAPLLVASLATPAMPVIPAMPAIPPPSVAAADTSARSAEALSWAAPAVQPRKPRSAGGSRMAAPSLDVDRGDRGAILFVGALPDVLSRPEVRPHLTTGLTTSLAIRVTATDALGRRARGGGRVDVRYELWDEVFLVRAAGAVGAVGAIGNGGAGRRDSLPSFDRLVAWWRGLRLPAVDAAVLDPAGPWQVEVEVAVIPFSQAEEAEARRWVSESVQKSGARELSAAGEEPSEGLSGVLDLLVATSIQRRSLVRYDWKVQFRPSPAPERRR